jgi:hypothetical protein
MLRKHNLSKLDSGSDSEGDSGEEVLSLKEDVTGCELMPKEAYTPDS